MLQKALFFDIDGTIISEQTGRIPNSTIEALTRTKENGHLLFINSGRTRCSIPPVLLPMPFDGFLCGCGTELIYNGESFYHHTLSPDAVHSIIMDFINYDCDGLLEGSDFIYFPPTCSRFSEVERIRHTFKQLGIAKTYPTRSISIDKFVFFTDIRSNTMPMIEKLSQNYDVIDRRHGFYEVVPKGHSKATAIHAILKKFHISTENAYVFGDSTNDLPMFQCVPNAIAMGHHDRTLEEHCSYITRTVEEDGIYHALRHLHII